MLLGSIKNQMIFNLVSHIFFLLLTYDCNKFHVLGYQWC